MKWFSLAFAVLAFGVTCMAEETKVALSDLPKGGLDAVRTMFPAAQVVGAARETEDGKTFYEVTLKQAGRTIDVTVDPAGKIQLVEKEIASKDLPKAVADALSARYAKATYKIVEEVSAMKAGKLALDFYEALVVAADGKRVEVQIEPDGKVRHEEPKSKESD